MSFLIEMWNFFRARKKFWLLPIMIVLLIVGGVIIVSSGSPVAPLIYTIF